MTMTNQAILNLLCLICISLLPNLLLAFTDKDGAYAYDVIVVGTFCDIALPDETKAARHENAGGKHLQDLSLTETIERELVGVP
jgi:hypothetical protein